MQKSDDRALSLMSEMELTPEAILHRLQFVSLEAADIERIASIAGVVKDRVEELTSVFFAALARFEEAAGVVGSPATLAEARHLKAEHLRAMVEGDYGPAYVQARLALVLLYSRAGLDVRVFLGAFHDLIHAIGSAILSRPGARSVEDFECFMSVKKVAFFDLTLVVDVLIFERQRVIETQRTAIRALSTPVLQIRERLLILPIVGLIDAERARQIMNSVLGAVRAKRARAIVIDVTGVPFVDTEIARHLMNTANAARLMGATAILSGVSEHVAEALVTLGIDMGSVRTVGDLQAGIEAAEQDVALGEAVPR